MADLRQFAQRLKFVRIQDVLRVFPMGIGFVCSIPYRVFHRNIWLICERENEARDNGYWFFKYMRESHPEIQSIYAINKAGLDYERVKGLGKTIQYGSLMHWIYYFAAKWNISSQKEGKPNAALCFILEVYLGLQRNRIYLKHGIVKDAQRWIYYDVSKITMICTASKREQSYIQQMFGYPPNSVVLTGLCRFDNLLSPHEVKRQILVMPTMREWLRTISSDTLKYEKTTVFTESEYFCAWSSFIHNRDLHKLLEENQVDLIFYPHPAMQKYVNRFQTECERITIGSDSSFDIQLLLMESSLLITDYSSIYFDFAYMKKPLLYYQFDYDKYRKGQYQEGYFSYEDDGFGEITKGENELISLLGNYINNSFTMKDKYIERVQRFFEFCDKRNCERTYNAIINLQRN